VILTYACARPPYQRSFRRRTVCRTGFTLEYEFTDALADPGCDLQSRPVLPPVPLQKLLPASPWLRLHSLCDRDEVDWRMYLPVFF